MTNRRYRPVRNPFLIVLLAAAALLPVQAQQPAARLTAEISSAQQNVLSGSRSPLARPSSDLGRLSAGTRLSGITLVFSRSAAQEAALKSLLTAQQTPSSSQYHQWLTPDTFAARFGLADSDLAKITSWLQQQGFSVDNIARSKTRITFSGSVTQVETAFHTEVHSYKTEGAAAYAPSTDLSIPTSLSSVVASVANLSSFRPRAFMRVHPNAQASPQFTSSQSSAHFLTPGDLATIYDINAAYKSGYTGSGQSIAVMGQSFISVSDIEHFESAAGLTVKDPTLVLVPDSGTAAVSTGDEAESDLDIEYSGATATGAFIYLVYVGNNTSYSVFDSIEYAVDTRIAPILSVSYGSCETELSSADFTSLESILQQASSQGQTLIAASGDDGSTGCSGETALTTAQQEALGVSYPASSQYATGLGGTEFSAADVATSNTTYWQAANSSDIVSSALSYIPEQVWNDDAAASGISSGGGGVSSLATRPSWQSGVAGIPSGAYRLVPDIALTASPTNAGFLYCSSDSTATGITGSCANGFRDSTNTYLTAAGGTSFDAPIFAGMLALINQKENSSGQGVINPTLYQLAANAATYASVFHDITTGSNACTAGSTYCSTAGASEYAAAVGYDQASGLGSIDAYNLLTNWPASKASSLAGSTTTLSPVTPTPASGASDIITVTVAPSASTSTAEPTGSVAVTVDGATVAASLALTGGTASYTFSSTVGGEHVVTATYSGDNTYGGSTASVTLTVPSTASSSAGSFSLVATNVTIAQGNSGSSTLTLASQNAYAGTVDLTLSTASASLQTYGCYSVASPTLTAGATITTAITLYTSQAACTGASAARQSTRHPFTRGTSAVASLHPATPEPLLPVGTAACASLLLCSLGAGGTRRYRLLSALLLFTLLGLTVGCGTTNSSTSTSTDVAKGTYSFTVTGTDATNTNTTSTTTFTLAVN